MDIKYNYLFIYYKGDDIIKTVRCTAYETLEAAKIMLNEFGADRVIKKEV